MEEDDEVFRNSEMLFNSNSYFLYSSFNFDGTSFTFGTEKGFGYYQSDPFLEKTKQIFGEGIGIVESLENSNILAFVGGGSNPRDSPNKISIWDDYLYSCVAEIELPGVVKGVKLSKERILATTENRVYVFDFETLKRVGKYDTVPNPDGLGLLSPITNTIAYLTNKIGEVCISKMDGNKYIIKAHDHNIQKFSLSYDETLLATASTRGTLIRVFDSTMSGNTPLKEFRRGYNDCLVKSICFDRNSRHICVSSNTETMHLFSIENRTTNTKKGWWFSGNTEEKDFFNFKVFPNCQITFSENNSLIVLTPNGVIYKYTYSQKDNNWTIEQEWRNTV